MVDKIVGVGAKAAGRSAVPEKDGWAVDLGISTIMGSSVGMVAALLRPSTLGDDGLCHACGNVVMSLKQHEKESPKCRR